MEVREAIQNALDFIEAKNGHTDGDIYADLKMALYIIARNPEIAEKKF